MRAALIPVKELAQAKMRLADVLDRRERAELVLAMLTDVLTACLDDTSLDAVVVISRDADVLHHARDFGAEPLAEPDDGDLNAALAFGQRHIAARASDAALIIVPADVPLVRIEDLREVLGALGPEHAPGAALVRARDGGTNALAICPPGVIATRFGRGSADAHAAVARSAGVPLTELALPRLGFDVDAPDDLARLAALRPGAATSGWLEARAHYARRD